MPDHPIPHPDLAGYLLGGLEDDELAAFEEHSGGCAACQRELADMGLVPSLLRRATPAVEPPPPELEERTFAAVASEARQSTPAPRVPAPRRRRGVRLPLALAAAAALALFAVLFAVSANDDAHARIELVAASADQQWRGVADVRSAEDGLAIDLEVSGLPPNQPGTVYACWWFVDSSNGGADPPRVSAGTFTVDADGRAAVHMTAAGRLGENPRMGVTLERVGDEETPGQKILVPA
jgi:hypothetical protein